MRPICVKILVGLIVVTSLFMFWQNPVGNVEAQTYSWVAWYYPYSLRTAQYSVKITISGIPSESTATLKVDGNTVGTIPGGSTKEFEVPASVPHTFEVENYISGTAGVRYYCKEASWTLEKIKEAPYPYYAYHPYPVIYRVNYTSGTVYYYYRYPSFYYYPYYYPDPYVKPKLDVGHTFNYEPEYMLTVENPYGHSVEKSGWKAKDTLIVLTTPERIEKSSVERSVFKAWNVDGSEVGSSTVTLNMNMPHKATAVYKTQYYLEVRSELGQPQGSGWYDKDATATISVTPELSMPGLWGALGAKHVFAGWIGPAEPQNSPTARVTVNSPLTISADWRGDYTTAYIWIATIISVIAVACILAILILKRTLKVPGGTTTEQALENLKLRYSRGEISREEYLKMKKDIEKG
ncbi:MAG: SHOCT domain-containing protein [Candidatus Bathyarchaeia archaeon]